MARPTKYTPDVHERIVHAIELGAPYVLACQYGGVDYRTFLRWMKAKSQFCQDVKAAEGKAAFAWLEQIEAAARSGVWQAAAWKLERRYPQEFGRTIQEQRHEITGPGGGAIRIAFFDARAPLAALTAGSADDRASVDAG